MTMSDNERTVAFGYVDENTVGGTLIEQHQRDNFGLSAIANAVPKFIPVEEYTTFRAEYVLQDGNIVIHFFLPTDFRGSKGDYWAIQFPKALDATAQHCFQATRPRLQAKYTEELESWWLRALSYEHIIDLRAFLYAFFDLLDATLEARA
jgi:hypothetical protein